QGDFVQRAAELAAGVSDALRGRPAARHRRARRGSAVLGPGREPLHARRHARAERAAGARTVTLQAGWAIQSLQPAAELTPSRRDICWMPVGLVTLISVSLPPITSRPTK